MKLVKVSVIVPVYNSEKYLRECLDSILSQTLQDIEIICVDDGSTDKSMEILNDYASRDERFIILHQKNQYAGVARNNGMQIAKGEYLAFLDSDDFFDRELLEKTYTQGCQTKADIVVFGAMRFDTNTGEYIKQTHYFRRNLLPNKDVFSREDIPDSIFQLTLNAPWTKLFRRQFIEEQNLKFQSLKHSNDIYFSNMAIVLAEKISYVDADLVFYRTGQTENLQSNKDKDPILFFQAYKAIYQCLKEKNLYEMVGKSFSNAFVSSCAFNLDSVQTEAARLIIYQMLCGQDVNEMNVLSRPLEDYTYPEKLYLLRGSKYILEWHDKTSKKQEGNLRKIIDMRNSQMPYISVVIPVYNVELYLRQCLDSIKNQTLPQIEVICIDDGSVDSSLDILTEYARNDCRFCVYHQDNSGQSSARNAGIRLARGKYLYFMDSDDILDLCALETVYTQAEELKLDVLYFDGLGFTDDDECQEELETHRDYYCRKYSYSEIYQGSKLMTEMVENEEYRVQPCLQLINREYFFSKDLWFYEGIIYEDNLFNFKCILNASRVSHIQKRLFYRRYRPASTTTKSRSFAHVYGYFCCYVEMNKFLMGLHLDKKALSAALEILRRVLNNAREKYWELSEEMQYAVLGLPLCQRSLFQLYIVEYVKLKQSNRGCTEKMETALSEESEISRKLQITYEETADRERRITILKERKQELEKKVIRMQKYMEALEQSETYKLYKMLLRLKG